MSFASVLQSTVPGRLDIVLVAVVCSGIMCFDVGVFVLKTLQGLDYGVIIQLGHRSIFEECYTLQDLYLTLWFCNLNLTMLILSEYSEYREVQSLECVRNHKVLPSSQL